MKYYLIFNGKINNIYIFITYLFFIDINIYFNIYLLQINIIFTFNLENYN